MTSRASPVGVVFLATAGLFVVGCTTQTTAVFEALLDPVVAPALGETSRDALQSLGYDVDWRTYPMPHSLCAEEVGDLREWLLRVLPSRGETSRPEAPGSTVET